MPNTPQPYILWLTENYFPNTGGMAQSCDRIVQGLRNSGINIGLVHFRNTRTKLKYKNVSHGFNLVCPVNEDEGHTFHILYNFLTNPALGITFTHVVAFGGYMPLLGAPVISKLLDIPLISMLRGNDFDLALFSPKKREMLFYALMQSEIVCTVSMEQKFKINKLLKHSKVIYVPNGIALNDWAPHKSEMDRAADWKSKHVPENKRVIGVFGHLKPKKGMEFFLDSLIRSGRQNEVFLLITGEIYPGIQEKLETCDIEYFTSPYMDRYELLAWYPVCDAVAIPSFYDGMPNVLLEAGALGIPIIASMVGGTSDLINSNELGFTFHPGDEEACASAINEFMLMDRKDLSAIGQKLKHLISENFNSEIENQKYLDIFKL